MSFLCKETLQKYKTDTSVEYWPKYIDRLFTKQEKRLDNNGKVFNSKTCSLALLSDL